MRFLILVGLCASLATASSINYNGFGGDTSNLQLNGNASIQGTALQLVPNLETQAGSAFEKTAIAFDTRTTFSTFFKFNIATDTGNPTDGFAFVLQNEVVTALGGAGQANGFADGTNPGITPSLAVIFRDRNPAFIGAVVNGVDTLNNDPKGPEGATHFPEDQEGAFYNKDEYAWIEYDPELTTLRVYLSDTITRPDVAILTTVIDASSILGSQAWVGFSAGNGGGTGTQNILSWSFESSEVPEPGTAGLYVLGLGLAVFARKRLAAR